MSRNRGFGAQRALAARYAALAITADPTDTVARDQVLVLRDDILAALTGIVHDLAEPPQPKPHRDGSAPLTDPRVADLLARLTMLPRATTWEQRDPPSTRWAGLPDNPTVATTTGQVWKGLAVHATLAADALHRAHQPLSAAGRWAALEHVAVLAEALTCADPILYGTHGAQRRTLFLAAQAVGVAAREVILLTASNGPDIADAAAATAPERRLVVVPVARVASLGAATDQLGVLLCHSMTTSDLGMPVLLAATTALARASHSAATVLSAAGVDAGAGIPDLLRDAADKLATHSAHLRAASAAAGSPTQLATLHAGSGAVRAQAGEIGAQAVRALQDAARRSHRALAVTVDLLRYADAVEQTSGALAQAYAQLDRSGRLLVHDRRTERASERGWIPTHHLEDPTRALRASLTTAVEAAAGIRTPQVAARDGAAVRGDLVHELRHAINEHHATRRLVDPPTIPSAPRPASHGMHR